MISIEGKNELLQMLTKLEEVLTDDDMNFAWHVYATDAVNCLMTEDYDMLERHLFWMHLTLGERAAEIIPILQRLKMLKGECW